MPWSVDLAGPNVITHGSPLMRQPLAVLTAFSNVSLEAVPLKPRECVAPRGTLVQSGNVSVISQVALPYMADAHHQPAAGKPLLVSLMTGDLP